MAKLNLQPYPSLKPGQVFLMLNQAQSARIDLDEVRIKVSDDACVHVYLVGADPIIYQVDSVDPADVVVPTQLELRLFPAMLKVYQQMGFGIWLPGRAKSPA